MATGSSTHQSGAAVGVRQVDTRAALQQHQHHRLLPSIGGPRQQRCTFVLCAARVHAAALVQPCSHGLRIAPVRRIRHVNRQLLVRRSKPGLAGYRGGRGGLAGGGAGCGLGLLLFALALLGRRLLLRRLLPKQLRRHRVGRGRSVRRRGGRPDLRLSRLPRGVLPQQLRRHGLLLLLGPHERRPAGEVLQRGIGLGVEQRLHGHGVALSSSEHQGGETVGVPQVDARSALQQHPDHRISILSQDGPYQQRRTLALCAARVHSIALVQPRSHSLHVAPVRRARHGFRQPHLHRSRPGRAGQRGSCGGLGGDGGWYGHGFLLLLALLGRRLFLRRLLPQQLRRHRVGRGGGMRRRGLRLSRLRPDMRMLPQQLSCRGSLELLGPRERRPAVGALQRGVGLGVEQRLHDRGTATDGSPHQSGEAERALQVDARAALQQHLHYRLLPSCGGPHQQRRAALLCAAHVHAAALVQPRSHSLRVALARRDHGTRQFLPRQGMHTQFSVRGTRTSGCNRLGGALTYGIELENFTINNNWQKGNTSSVRKSRVRSHNRSRLSHATSLLGAHHAVCMQCKHAACTYTVCRSCVFAPARTAARAGSWQSCATPPWRLACPTAAMPRRRCAAAAASPPRPTRAPKHSKK
eukprot:scaffold28640_cov75-Phaeocystis_antarctica.AAC.2